MFLLLEGLRRFYLCYTDYDGSLFEIESWTRCETHENRLQSQLRGFICTANDVRLLPWLCSEHYFVKTCVAYFFSFTEKIRNSISKTPDNAMVACAARFRRFRKLGELLFSQASSFPAL